MEKCITLGKKQITIRATAGVLVIYKEQFGTEYMEDTAALEFDEEGRPMTEEDGRRALTIGGQLLWAMAKAADDRIRHRAIIAANSFFIVIRPLCHCVTVCSSVV